MSNIDSIKKHVHHLSVEIGPRGSTTPEEKRAAEYAEQVYRDIGLIPITEQFTSAKSAWYPFAFATLLVLFAEALFLLFDLPGAILASLLTVYVVISLVLELSFNSNPIRWILPKGRSQNVSAVIEPASDVKQTIVIVGHLDTHRMPITYRSMKWFSLFNRLTTLSFVSAILMLAIFIIRIFFVWDVLNLITLILCIPILLILMMAISADFTSYTNGANDNASGAAITMGLAEKLAQNPLQNSRVWAVNVGCEEVGSYGASAWVESRIDEIGDAVYLTVDNVGGKGAGPCYLTKEALIFPFSSDSGLVAMADKLAEENPGLGAYSREMRAAYTDGAIGIKAGLRCLTFVGYTPEGTIPDWHQPTDVYENIDWDAVERTETFVWLLIQAVDRAAS